MTEFKDTPMQMFRREAFCDCGGSMTYIGKRLTSMPNAYEHGCEACGKVECLKETYPATIYKVSGEQQ